MESPRAELAPVVHRGDPPARGFVLGFILFRQLARMSLKKCSRPMLRCDSLDLWWQGDSAMMGDRLVMQECLFYEFCLDEFVPSDHMLRTVDRFVDLSDLRQHLGAFYSSMGRPSIDPELMIRMLLVGYC